MAEISNEGLADRSVQSYERLLNHWAEYMREIMVGKIAAQDISTYLTWLRTEYTPQRFNGKTTPLSPKTIRNVWVTLSSFFTWASREFALPNPVKEVPAPKFQKTQTDPFTQDEVERMLKACVYTREANTDQRHKFVMRRATANRDRAILLVLLDTGLRASEVSALKIGDVDAKRGKVEIKHGVEGGAKGGKGRIVYLAAAWRPNSVR